MMLLSFLSSWLPVSAWAGLIFWLSSIPSLNTGWGVWDFILRKGAHMFEYAVLTLLLLRAVGKTWNGMTVRRNLFWSALAALMYALSDEWHQAFVPGRGPSLGDVAIDGVGVALAVAAYIGMVRFVQRPGGCCESKGGAKSCMCAGLAIAFTLALLGCGSNWDFSRARAAEKKGDAYKAWQRYQKFAVDHPKHPQAAEALFRAGWLAERYQKDCTMAEAFYDGVIEKYPQSDPWARLAVQRKNNCPDYFPLIEGAQWVEGDSDTKGKNARIEIVAKPWSQGKDQMTEPSAMLVRTYYAGQSKFKTTEFIYKKGPSELLEFISADDPRPKIILKWPYDPGTRWETKMGGRTFLYEIVAADKTVEVAAGEFQNCLLVRSSVEGIPGATNEYYAPSVGRVLSTFSTPDGEKRNIELLSYAPAPEKEEIP